MISFFFTIIITHCGLATLAMVLNALQIDPRRLWKSPWRWFSEDLLDCCIPLEVITKYYLLMIITWQHHHYANNNYYILYQTVKKQGITFSEFACLSKCNGSDVKAFRSGQRYASVFSIITIAFITHSYYKVLIRSPFWKSQPFMFPNINNRMYWYISILIFTYPSSYLVLWNNSAITLRNLALRKDSFL